MGRCAVDEANKNQPVGRVGIANRSDHDSSAAFGNDSASPRVRACSWCKAVTVFAAEQRAEDVIVLYVQGTDARAMWRGKPILVQDGICEGCRAEKFPETVKP